MIDTLKTIGISVVVVIVALLLSPFGGSNVGGTYENVRQYFSAGIDVTGTGDIKVDGTTVIDASGSVDAALTPSSYTNPIEAITADDTLVAADSGKVIYIGTAGVDLTLPTAAAAAGVTYRTVVSANFATTNMTVTGPASDATDDTIYGALEVAGAVVACSAEDTISFVNTAELPGDFIEIHSDGSKWYITGQGTTAGSITCTDAD